MIQLRLTEKLRKEIGVAESALREPMEIDSGWGSWTLNLFLIGGRKSIIFVNDKTLYSFVLYGLRKDNSKNFGELFFKGLAQLLTEDEFTPKQIAYAMASYDRVEFTKTVSRQVLGNANDLVVQYQILIDSEGGLAHANLGKIIRQVNRMPQKNLGWRYSIDAVRELLTNA